MTFFLYLIGLLVVGTIAAFVAFPLFMSHRDQELRLEPEDLFIRWEKQKADAYAAIKEADFDRQMGKLTDEDYRVLRRKYETRALEALAQLDRLRASEKKEGQLVAATEASD